MVLTVLLHFFGIYSELGVSWQKWSRTKVLNHLCIRQSLVELHAHDGHLANIPPSMYDTKPERGDREGLLAAIRDIALILVYWLEIQFWTVFYAIRRIDT